jgi:hypothetical protein
VGVSGLGGSSAEANIMTMGSSAILTRRLALESLSEALRSMSPCQAHHAPGSKSSVQVAFRCCIWTSFHYFKDKDGSTGLYCARLALHGR